MFAKFDVSRSLSAAEPNCGNQGNHQEKSQQIAKSSWKRNQNPEGKTIPNFNPVFEVLSQHN